MIFRRILAGILVLLFVVLSLMGFMVFAVSNTIFSGDFYEKKISGDAYNFLVNVTVKNLISENEYIEKYFTEADLRREIAVVFPETMYDKMVKQVIVDMETLKQDPSKPLTLKLTTYRESLLTLAHNLSFSIFDSIPTCKGGEFPEEGEKGLPSCIPNGIEYNVVAAPFTEEFEKSVYASVPEQIQIDLNSTVGEQGFMLSNVFQAMDTVKIIIYGLLLGILICISLLIWQPFASIMSYIGTAFFVSGISGLIIGYMLPVLAPAIAEKVDGDLFVEDVKVLMDRVFVLFSTELQKGPYVFLALGAILVLMRLFIKKR